MHQTPLMILRKKLQMHRRDCSEIPPDDDKEKRRRECVEKLLLLKIECEEWRQSIRITYQLCHAVTITETIEGVETAKTRTFFKWEDLRKLVFDQISDRELKGIEHYENRIKQLSL